MPVFLFFIIFRILFEVLQRVDDVVERVFTFDFQLFMKSHLPFIFLEPSGCLERTTRQSRVDRQRPDVSPFSILTPLTIPLPPPFDCCFHFGSQTFVRSANNLIFCSHFSFSPSSLFFSFFISINNISIHLLRCSKTPNKTESNGEYFLSLLSLSLSLSFCLEKTKTNVDFRSIFRLHDCTSILKPTHLIVDVLCVAANATCAHNEFQCKDGQCLKNSTRCNKKIDCKDKSDELNCFIGYKIRRIRGSLLRLPTLLRPKLVSQLKH